MARAAPSNLKNKKSLKTVEVSDSSDSERSDHEDQEYNSYSESEVEEIKTSTKEKVKKEKQKTAASSLTKVKVPISSRPSEKRKDKKASPSSSNKKTKKEYDMMFDDSDVKIDMSNDNIKPTKIKLTSNLLIECRTVVVDEPDKQKFSYPGIVFIRKMKDDKCFEFNIPLAIASRVVNAIEIMINDKNNFRKKE